MSGDELSTADCVTEAGAASGAPTKAKAKAKANERGAVD
jgi:hypothetical protein